MATVFYALALFQLPRTSLVLAFTLAVQGLTELAVSLKRIDDFLATSEPPTLLPTPSALRSTTDSLAGQISLSPSGATGGPSGATRGPSGATGGPSGTTGGPSGTTGGPSDDLPELCEDEIEAVVAMGGAPYSWAQPMGLTASVSGRAASTSTNTPAGKSGHLQSSIEPSASGPVATLSGISFRLKKGELLGICGEVGEKFDLMS